ncbi:(2Fe-2S)-binding protein [Acidisoma cellulosilytica]|uniref:(2Fe-2S)-binding protein n=2 Tax=Acidisoma cellulosilyticum TaxID=2802395 RepID=A0A964E424_9PROT|nr:(2Fe-2S)-binding protein [Acidisoma cellulosilyticum]
MSLTVNGKPVGPIDVPNDMMMLDFLHDYLNLTGSRFGCGQGICHACTIILDDPVEGAVEMRTCVTGAHFFAEKRVRTIEGHATRDAKGDILQLTPVQQAFIEHFAFQCGYCTPGFVTGTQVLIERLRKTPIARADVEKTIEQALAPHICRCTGYVRYYEAIRAVILSTPGLVSG